MSDNAEGLPITSAVLLSSAVGALLWAGIIQAILWALGAA